jgi:hypothetical protein
MPIQRMGQFLITQDIEFAPSLGIESHQLRDCVAEINRTGIESAFAGRAFAFAEDNLDFLEELPHLKQIWFWEVKAYTHSKAYSILVFTIRSRELTSLAFKN